MNPSSLKLSIVDQSPVSAGFTPADALQHTLELARLADRLGYERFWIAEHHGMPRVACPAPEILMGIAASQTTRIRIGSGAVLLPHYSPYKVAETFRLLHALYPGRIDLGIGRAPGGTSLEARALRRERDRTPPPDDFAQQLAELLAFLQNDFPEDHPFARVHVSPAMPGGPELWLLGSSLWSADAAAQLGLPYAFAHFINPEPTGQALVHYRAHFDPEENESRPRALVALGAVVADTGAEAERIFASTRLAIRRIRQGDTRPIPTPEEALREIGLDPDPIAIGFGEWPRYVHGAPEQVKEQLTRIADSLGVDELMIVTVVHDPAARLRSYELLADVFGLSARSCSVA